MNTIRNGRWLRRAAWLVLASLVWPYLAGCATPSSPKEIVLAGVVINGDHRAEGPEWAQVGVWRGTQQLPARAGLVLQKGDWISTGPGTEAVVRFPNGSELFMAPSSGGRIGSLTEAIGEFFVKVRGFFNIDTEFVRAGARGTAYGVRAGADGQASVWVVRGQVEVASLTGAWAPVSLGPGMATMAYPMAPTPYAATPEQMQRSEAWERRMERLVPAQTAGLSAGEASALALGALAVGILISGGGRSSGDGTVDRTQRSPDYESPQTLARETPRASPSVGITLNPGVVAAPSPAASLAAPEGTHPGASSGGPMPVLDCRRANQLNWLPVAGASGYRVTLQRQDIGGRRWADLPMADAQTTTAALPAGLTGRLRWWVQALGPQGPGPSSTPRVFDCGDGYGPR